MLDIYAPSFVFEHGIFAALVPQHSRTNASVYLRGQYLSRSGSSTFIYICHYSSSRTESFLSSLLDLDIQTSLSSFILKDIIIPALVLQEFLHLGHRPSSSMALSSGLVPRLRHVCYVHTRGLNFPCPGFSISAQLAAQSSAKMRLYRRFSLFGRFQTPGPHPTLSPAAPALAWSRNRGQRPSAENSLRLSDRIPRA